jgi:hypothetical protein
VTYEEMLTEAKANPGKVYRCDEYPVGWGLVFDPACGDYRDRAPGGTLHGHGGPEAGGEPFTSESWTRARGLEGFEDA